MQKNILIGFSVTVLAVILLVGSSDATGGGSNFFALLGIPKFDDWFRSAPSIIVETLPVRNLSGTSNNNFSKAKIRTPRDTSIISSEQLESGLLESSVELNGSVMTKKTGKTISSYKISEYFEIGLDPDKLTNNLLVADGVIIKSGEKIFFKKTLPLPGDLLQFGTTYYYRAKVAYQDSRIVAGIDSNSKVAYGTVKKFVTFADPAYKPVISEVGYSNGNNADGSMDGTTFYGYIDPKGFSTSYYFEYIGNKTPTQTISGKINTKVSVKVTKGLVSNQLNQFVLRASNAAGEASSSIVQFRPLFILASISAPTNITSNTATFNASITPFSTTFYTFVWGTSTSSLTYSDTGANDYLGPSGISTKVSANISNLIPKTIYYYRIQITSSNPTLKLYTPWRTFTTK